MDLRVGKRTLKTALAVVISLYIGSLLQLETPLFAGFSAVIVMQASVYDSFRVAKDRMLATITGALVALLFVYLQFDNYFAIAMGIVIVIWINTNFKWKNSVALGCITFLIIVINEGGENELLYAFHRSLDTLIGLVVGTSVNLLIFPPHPMRMIVATYKKIEDDLFQVLKDFLESDKPMKLSLIQGDLVKAESDYGELKKQRRLRMINTATLDSLEEVNILLFQIVSHMTVVGARKDRRHLSRRALNKVQQILPDVKQEGFYGAHDLYDDLYSYHIEKITELMLLIRDKMQVIYQQVPRKFPN